MAAKPSINRRTFLQYTGLLTGAAATLGLASVAPAADSHDNNAHPMSRTEANDIHLNRGRMFFTNATEFSTLADAAERIFPKDELGPGAKDLAVPYFIDNQLAGAWGYNAREYTGAPHYPGNPTQGSQTALLRRDVFKQGLRRLNDTAQERFSKDFSRLTEEEQDAILTDCAAGNIPMSGMTSSYFFSLLREAVLAGVYSDPIYNGNNNMDGWRMKQYPGAQMAYLHLINQAEFELMEPISLASMQ